MHHHWPQWGIGTAAEQFVHDVKIGSELPLTMSVRCGSVVFNTQFQ